MSRMPADLINVSPELFPQSEDDKYLHVKNSDRWEPLKPVIVELYTGNYGKNNKPPAKAQIVEFMRKYYSFYATESAYANRFRQWGVSDRRLTKAKLNEIAVALERRPTAEMSTSKVSLKRGACEAKLDARQVKRHLANGTSSSKPQSMQSGWLSSWALPYAAFVSALPKNPDAASPYGTQPATPGYLGIKSERLSDEPIFGGTLRGSHRQICVDYFHEFYMHGFLTAKNWGSPPSISKVRTPSAFLEFPSSSLLTDASNHIDIVNPPTNLCRWSIHVKEIEYEPLPEEQPDSFPTSRSFPECLQNSISTGDFTELRNDNLPLSHETVIQSLTKNPLALELDSWKLAIMAGNADLLYDLGKKGRTKTREEVKSIHPYHLAASFLNGGGTCCTIFDALSTILGRSYLLQHNINDLGHTILDSLLVSILRSHTSVQPEMVSDGFRALSRFPGEEKDICGRWDADSPEVRGLFAQGYARIPTRWKHPFCHSAVQAVCHCAISTFGGLTHADVNCLSGLFVRRCTECGMELRLGPLHTLVAAAFFLGQSGMSGETLFGPVAILVCLINMGIDVNMRKNISVEEILRTSEPGQCHHRSMTAAEMMMCVPASVVHNWTNACQVGWDCLLHTLRLAESSDTENSYRHDRDSPECELSAGETDGESQSSECGLQDIHDDEVLKCTHKMIGIMWATIQAEMLTYRRLTVNDPWISDNFQMLALQAWLKGETQGFNTPLVVQDMMKTYSRCGWFYETKYVFWVIATSSDVCKEWFANLDNYGRTTFVPGVEFWGE
ncbi:hypothetical protein FPSE_03728 [Fusarium pseudograminearum CS3096]|uniref:Clr5 domain-containing protein n=1 Tax=Fusarium pseudograminearum (strain CS3096) TaxID=1028729 RepID=K3UU60_FUSPC|nr:hypothetical protein FPSE_03728 [Fusarium pseudograminearum CS3096]EKJ76096.1 hypothetical protein FPSE_03728 [Fusarium pseudograminearum CS3096]